MDPSACSICLRKSTVIDLRNVDEHVVCSGCKNQFYLNYKKIYQKAFLLPDLMNLLQLRSIQNQNNEFMQTLVDFIDSPKGCHKKTNFKTACYREGSKHFEEIGKAVKICPKCRFRLMVLKLKPKPASFMKDWNKNACYIAMLRSWGEIVLDLRRRLGDGDFQEKDKIVEKLDTTVGVYDGGVTKTGKLSRNCDNDGKLRERVNQTNASIVTFEAPKSKKRGYQELSTQSYEFLEAIDLQPLGKHSVTSMNPAKSSQNFEFFNNLHRFEKRSKLELSLLSSEITPSSHPTEAPTKLKLVYKVLDQYHRLEHLHVYLKNIPDKNVPHMQVIFKPTMMNLSESSKLGHQIQMMPFKCILSENFYNSMCSTTLSTLHQLCSLFYSNTELIFKETMKVMLKNCVGDGLVKKESSKWSEMVSNVASVIFERHYSNLMHLSVIASFDNDYFYEGCYTIYKFSLRDQKKMLSDYYGEAKGQKMYDILLKTMSIVPNAPPFKLMLIYLSVMLNFAFIKPNGALFSLNSEEQTLVTTLNKHLSMIAAHYKIQNEVDIVMLLMTSCRERFSKQLWRYMSDTELEIYEYVDDRADIVKKNT